MALFCHIGSQCSTSYTEIKNKNYSGLYDKPKRNYGAKMPRVARSATRGKFLGRELVLFCRGSTFELSWLVPVVLLKWQLWSRVGSQSERIEK